MIVAWLVGCGAPEPRSADACGACHTAVHEAWSGSAHGAGTSEVFDAWLPEVRAVWGPEAAARCVACHEPGFVEGEEVGCAACHSAVGNRTEADGALVVDLGAPISGRATGAPHALADRPFGRSSALCATCHEVTGPGLLEERTGTEHREAGSARTCADCHLDGHTFAVEPLFAEAVAVRLAVVRDGVVRVEVENVDAGHAVPTGAAFVRDLYVDLSVGGEVVAPRVLEVGPRPARAGRPVPLLTDADGVLGEALQVGEVAAVEVALPVGVSASGLEATLWFGRYRRDLLEVLDVAGPPPTAVGHARLP